MPYLINAKENELKRLKITTDEGFLSDEDFRPEKAREYSLLGIGEEKGRWDTDSNSGIF